MRGGGCASPALSFQCLVMTADRLVRSHSRLISVSSPTRLKASALPHRRTQCRQKPCLLCLDMSCRVE